MQEKNTIMKEKKDKHKTPLPSQPTELNITVESGDSKSSWTNLFRSISGLIWAVIVLIILAAAGKMLLIPDMKDEKITVVEKSSKSIQTQPSILRGKIDQDILQAFTTAQVNTELFASERLQEWVDSLMVRVDGNFLDWHFSYFHQQMIGFKSLIQQGLYIVSENLSEQLPEILEEQPTAAERLTEEFQEEFGQRVLRREIAQMELERITREIVEYYVHEVQQNIDSIKAEYTIPQGEWDRYLDDISFIIGDVEGSRNVSLTVKTIAAGGVGGAALTAKLIGKMAGKISSKTGAAAAGKAGAALAGKTGAKVAAKMGGKMLGLYAGIGIIIWDILDHYSTAKTNRPILRQNINDYLLLVKDTLLHDPETGIMTEIMAITNSLTFER